MTHIFLYKSPGGELYKYKCWANEFTSLISEAPVCL